MKYLSLNYILLFQIVFVTQQSYSIQKKLSSSAELLIVEVLPKDKTQFTVFFDDFESSTIKIYDTLTNLELIDSVNSNLKNNVFKSNKIVDENICSQNIRIKIRTLKNDKTVNYFYFSRANFDSTGRLILNHADNCYYIDKTIMKSIYDNLKNPEIKSFLKYKFDF